MRALVFLVAVSCCAAQLALPYGQPWALPYAKLDISPEDETLVKPVALPTPYLHPYSYPLAGQALGALPYTYPLTYAVKPEPTLEATEFPLIFKAAESARRRRRDVVEVPLPYLHAVPTVKKATYETKTLETLEAATPADTTKLEIVTKEHEIDIPAVKYVRPVAKFQPIKQTVVSPAFLPYSYGPFSAYNPFLTIKPAEE